MNINCRKLICSVSALFIFSFIVIAPPRRLAGQIVKSIQSYEVHSDGTITFRYLDTGAKHVQVSIGGLNAPVPMTNTGGVWIATTPQLPPEIYWYYFIVDGQPQMDPLNGVVLPNFVYLSNVVVVPGAAPQLWEATNVPHGELHQHFYKSRYSNEVPGERREVYRYSAPNHSMEYRDYYVYTPPGYDPKNSRRYPILYLLHGYAQTAADWTVPGGANFILDNLIAEDKTKPMILVMPVCYGWAVDNCSDAIRNEILPQVESEYKVLNDRNHRAIAGLSLGAMESFYIAFNHPELFAWVGSFSAGDIRNLPIPLPMDHTRISFRQLWISCGVNDPLLPKNQQLIADLKENGFPLTAVETPGTHDWTAWHYSLTHFVQLLFQKD
jgi:enterochelin esterase-like enzyme